jgi:hypothetical protein
MIIKKLEWTVAVLLACGCSTSSVEWAKTGASQATFSKDKSECEDLLLATGTTGYSKNLYTFESCMEAKGYRAIPASSQ